VVERCVLWVVVFRQPLYRIQKIYRIQTLTNWNTIEYDDKRPTEEKVTRTPPLDIVDHKKPRISTFLAAVRSDNDSLIKH
jgi:hypothetical protein